MPPSALFSFHAAHRGVAKHLLEVSCVVELHLQAWVRCAAVMVMDDVVPLEIQRFR